jgi:hypothetical protein
VLKIGEGLQRDKNESLGDLKEMIWSLIFKCNYVGLSK